MEKLHNEVVAQSASHAPGGGTTSLHAGAITNPTSTPRQQADSDRQDTKILLSEADGNIHNKAGKTQARPPAAGNLKSAQKIVDQPGSAAPDQGLPMGTVGTPAPLGDQAQLMRSCQGLTSTCLMARGMSLAQPPGG
eukprot:CAMPEP_0119109214 /NCGR_PEP_ID=MMETSP1180-20130426/17773_1 /TAXON_ID=3052 ORGANISM="Chlamydomonas cf sp, Strain CCMP681" /NCGR_SAMPLE_ID=MMETSP1180 /ASSEMBLY_ACC=CAM_ASM_000741 /LENGTH=136 /DNA_ID=CAMNT_0007094943 /DNA_START=203 /DNA_END=614 /DNA_ORIENTATION=+